MTQDEPRLKAIAEFADNVYHYDADTLKKAADWCQDKAVEWDDEEDIRAADMFRGLAEVFLDLR